MYDFEILLTELKIMSTFQTTHLMIKSFNHFRSFKPSGDGGGLFTKSILSNVKKGFCFYSTSSTRIGFLFAGRSWKTQVNWKHFPTVQSIWCQFASDDRGGEDGIRGDAAYSPILSMSTQSFAIVYLEFTRTIHVKIFRLCRLFWDFLADKCLANYDYFEI